MQPEKIENPHDFIIKNVEVSVRNYLQAIESVNVFDKRMNRQISEKKANKFFDDCDSSRYLLVAKKNLIFKQRKPEGLVCAYNDFIEFANKEIERFKNYKF